MEERTHRGNGRDQNPFGQQQRQKAWEELSRRAGSVITDKNGVMIYVVQAPHELRQYLRRTGPAKEIVSFIDLDVLAKSQTPGQLPRTVLPAAVPETLNFNEIARVERITSPFQESEFIGVPVQETESFRNLQSGSSILRERERERELATAGR